MCTVTLAREPKCNHEAHRGAFAICRLPGKREREAYKSPITRPYTILYLTNADASSKFRKTNDTELVLAGGCGRLRYASELERVDLKMSSILPQKLARKIQTFAGQ